MFRKLTLGIAAAAALSAAALAPTAASAHGGGHHGHHGGFGGFGVVIGGPGYYGYDYAPVCQDVKVWSKKWHKFVWKTVCE